jgi:uncharacterized protein
LARELIHGERPYLTLDNQTTRLAAQTDPTGMIRDLDRAIIDEVQLAPDLLRAIKESIDNDRRPGRFLLTGSANILTLPKISESLAGLSVASRQTRRRLSRCATHGFARSTEAC